MEKHRSFFNSVITWFRLNAKSLALALIVAYLTFPAHALFYSPGIDESLPWVFNYFADGHFQLSENILFPHGRFAFLLYPLPMGYNVQLTILITLLSSVLFSMTLFRLAFMRHEKNYILTTVFLLVIQSVCDIQLLLIGLTVGQVLLYHFSKKRLHYFAAIVVAVFGLYIKTFCGVVCSLIIFSELIYILFTAKNYKLALQAFIVFVIVFYVVWLGCYHTFANSGNFLIGQLELTSDNSEAVTLYSHQSWRFISCSLISLFAIPFFSKDKQANYFFRIMVLSLFAVWKHTMSRADVTHLSSFVYFLVFFTFSFMLLMKEIRVRILILSIISISAFILNISRKDYQDFRQASLFKQGNLYDLIFNYEFESAAKNKISRKKTAGSHLADTIKKIIGTETVDVYPWNYSIIAVNKLNWQPRPVIQCYAAYTHWLDEQEAKHFQSKNSARFYIWELDKGMNIRAMESIDTRYLLNEEPTAIINFFSNYALRYKDEEYLVYEKREHAVETSSSIITPQYTFKNDEWTDVPACAPGCVLRAKLVMNKNSAGKLLAFIYKGEGFFITYEFEDNTQFQNRIVPKNAKDGVWLYPYIFDPSRNFLTPKIRRIKVRCTDNRLVDEDFKIEFEQIKFKFENGSGFFENEFVK